MEKHLLCGGLVKEVIGVEEVLGCGLTYFYPVALFAIQILFIVAKAIPFGIQNSRIILTLFLNTLASLHYCFLTSPLAATLTDPLKVIALDIYDLVILVSVGRSWRLLAATLKLFGRETSLPASMHLRHRVDLFVPILLPPLDENTLIGLRPLKQRRPLNPRHLTLLQTAQLHRINQVVIVLEYLVSSWHVRAAPRDAILRHQAVHALDLLLQLPLRLPLLFTPK